MQPEKASIIQQITALFFQHYVRNSLLHSVDYFSLTKKVIWWH